MWSFCRFKGGSRGFVVGGFPNFSPDIFTQNIQDTEPKLCFTYLHNSKLSKKLSYLLGY